MCCTTLDWVSESSWSSTSRSRRTSSSSVPRMRARSGLRGWPQKTTHICPYCFSAAVAARGHQATSLGIKISLVVDVFSSVPAARRKRQRDGLMAVSSAGRQGGAVGGQLWLCRHPAACLTSAGYRLPCQSAGGSSGAKDQSHSAAIAARHLIATKSEVCETNDPAILASGRVFERRLDGGTQHGPLSAAPALVP